MRYCRQQACGGSEQTAPRPEGTAQSIECEEHRLLSLQAKPLRRRAPQHKAGITPSFRFPFSSSSAASLSGNPRRAPAHVVKAMAAAAGPAQPPGAIHAFALVNPCREHDLSHVVLELVGPLRPPGARRGRRSCPRHLMISSSAPSKVSASR